MNGLWSEHANHLLKLINSHKDTQAHLYLEQLMLFPVDIQDKIIEDISISPICDKETIANILTYYTMLERNELH